MTIRRTELVGPVIGRELVRNALLALVIAGVGMLIYISSALNTVSASPPSWASPMTFHRPRRAGSGGQELNTPFIAGILTVVGYSINNTIVVFDRIRENLRLNPRRIWSNWSTRAFTRPWPGRSTPA